MKILRAAAFSVLVLVGTLTCQQWTTWTSTSTNAEILYRSQPFSNQKACYMEFRDDQQSNGNTTFDADVRYKSTDLDSEGKPIPKADTQHIVVTPAHVGTSRISNCAEVVEVKCSFVQRH